jgi:putative SOS response-associated peptidase YedK
MCERFLLTTPAQTVAEHFQLDEVPTLFPRYNIAPTQPIGVVRLAEDGPQLQPRRQWAEVRWGLVPPGAALSRKRRRRHAAHQRPVGNRRRQALVPGSVPPPSLPGPRGRVYEWKPAGRRKQPHVIRPAGGGLFALAGLWERWHGPGGAVLETAAVLTTEANAVVRPIHDLMPVIVRPEDYAAWLDLSRQEIAELNASSRLAATL